MGDRGIILCARTAETEDPVLIGVWFSVESSREADVALKKPPFNGAVGVEMCVVGEPSLHLVGQNGCVAVLLQSY